MSKKDINDIQHYKRSLYQECAECRVRYKIKLIPTNREVEILQLIFEGALNKEIAEKLEISEQTVKNHISDMLRTFGARDRTQLVVQALREGILKLNEDVNPSS